MPAAYVSLGVISTPEDEARLSETGEEDPYLTALAREVLKFAGLTEDLPPKPPAPVESARRPIHHSHLSRRNRRNHPNRKPRRMNRHNPM